MSPTSYQLLYPAMIYYVIYKNSPIVNLLAPRVGLEPTAYRLTAGCSTIELPRNNQFIRQRPTFPGSYPPSIISAKELNFRVRDGNGCVLFAIAAG